MGKLTKTIDIKRMTLLNVARIYVFMLDIKDALQSSNSNEIHLDLESPNLGRFPFIPNEVNYNGGPDWRDYPIAQLAGRKIIKCEGIRRPFYTAPHYAHQFNEINFIELEACNRSKFDNFLPKIESIYGEKHRKEKQLNSRAIEPKNAEQTTAIKSTANNRGTHKEEADRDSYEYRRRHKFFIPYCQLPNNSNNIYINGNKVPLGDSLLKLLLQLIIEIKKDKWGWFKDIYYTSKESSRSQSIHSKIGDLKVKLARGLPPEENMNKIIENGSKKYRISTHPNYIWCDKKGLMKHSNPEIKKLARRLRVEKKPAWASKWHKA